MDAHSEDLRRKLVEAVDQRRMKKSEAARAFGVSLSSVKRYAKVVREGRIEQAFSKIKSCLRATCARS